MSLPTPPPTPPPNPSSNYNYTPRYTSFPYAASSLGCGAVQDIKVFYNHKICVFEDEYPDEDPALICYSVDFVVAKEFCKLFLEKVRGRCLTGNSSRMRGADWQADLKAMVQATAS